MHPDRGTAHRHLPGARRSAPGAYNVYIDESNTTPLPGNGPNDAYQTATGTNLGTVESSTPIDVEGVMVVKTSTTAYPTAATRWPVTRSATTTQ